MQKLWSPETNPIGVFSEISKVIDRRLMFRWMIP
jgi:hypothetical protein